MKWFEEVDIFGGGGCEGVLSQMNFFSSEKTTFRHSFVLMVWYWRAYSRCFSLCFIVKLGRWILFLYSIFSLFKCLLIVLVLQGASTRDFNIFDVDEFLSFTSLTILLLNCNDIFLACQSVFLFHTYLDIPSYCNEQFYCIQRPYSLRFSDSFQICNLTFLNFG